MLLFDDEGQILAANLAAGELFGVPSAELTGKNLSVIGPAPGYDFRPGIQRLIETGSNKSGLRMTKGNGDPFDAEYHSRANILPGVHATVVRDVSDRKRVEASMKASEELFARAYIAAPIAMCATTLPDGPCILANEAFLALTGYWRSEMIGSRIPVGSLWANPADRARLSEPQPRPPAAPCPVALVRKDGSRVQALVCLSRTEINGKECELLAAFPGP